MAKRAPTVDEIVQEFEREIARSPRWAQVDRDLLQRLVDDHRRLSVAAQRLGEA